MARKQPPQKHPLSPALRREMATTRKRILERDAQTASQIAAEFVAVQRHLSRAQAAFVAAYTAELQRLADEAQAEADANGDDEPITPPTVPASWLQHSGHWQRYASVLIPALAGFAVAARLSITEGQRRAVVMGADDARTLLTTALAPALDPLAARLGMTTADELRRAPMSAVEALIGHSQAADKPLSALLDSLGEHVAQRTLALLMAALETGAHPSVVARQLADMTGMGYRRALTISRTEMIGAYRAANLAQFRASSDVLDGWTWVAAADACAFCESMNGTLHSLDETMDSHPNCRCAPSPHTKPLSDILSQFAA